MLEQWVRHHGAVEELTGRYPLLSWLKGKRLPKQWASEWYCERTGRNVRTFQIAFCGKTGYGKSTTLNRIVGKQVFETDDIRSCTRVLQSADYLLTPGGSEYLSLADLPGVGESLGRHGEYLQLYTDFLRLANVAVYLLRVDRRDYGVDEEVFETVFDTRYEREKVVIGLNAADCIAPVSRARVFSPGPEQRSNLARKVREVSTRFSVPADRVIPYSADRNWNLDTLLRRASETLYEKTEPIALLVANRQRIA